jgi:hypothetical protein
MPDLENESKQDDSGESSAAASSKKIEWSKENELIMVEWCDVAQCYKWLNSRAHMKYAYMNAWFTIPAIVLSTISGTASFAQTSIPAAYQTYSPMAIGSINILIGILTTVQQYLKISELNEAHRVSAISWDKFARNIRIELAKSPKERADASTFIKLSRHEFDRLMETSPAISKDIVADFKRTFSGKKSCCCEALDRCLGLGGVVDVDEINKRKRQFAALNKPDICDIIVTAGESRHKWYEKVEVATATDGGEPDLENRVEIDILDREEDLRKREQDIHDKELELAARIKLEKEAANKFKKEQENREEMARKEADVRVKSAVDKIENYKLIYLNSKGRIPAREEIYDHFKESIDSEILNSFL